jgi:hypothetical protein
LEMTELEIVGILVLLYTLAIKYKPNSIHIDLNFEDKSIRPKRLKNARSRKIKWNLQ